MKYFSSYLPGRINSSYNGQDHTRSPRKSLLSTTKYGDQRLERKVYHINLLKKWHHDDSSTSLLALGTEDTDCHGNDELEEEYLLETISQ